MASRGTISWEELHPAFNRLAQRFDAIEAQLSILSEKLGVPFTPLDAQVPPEVVELARAGKTIEAITQYRALTNAGPDEARGVVMGLG
jgi:hypothetical protein